MLNDVYACALCEGKGTYSDVLTLANHFIETHSSDRNCSNIAALLGDVTAVDESLQKEGLKQGTLIDCSKTGSRDRCIKVAFLPAKQVSARMDTAQ